MAKSGNVFALKDAATFDENLAAFGDELARIDSTLGPALRTNLNGLLEQTKTKADVLDALYAALAQAGTK